jgi:phospholipid/cholesterol/gamma-HCH transport system substrate-binding protein
MESRVNYTVVGLFVVLLTLAIAIIALWLTQNLQQKPYKTYLVYLTESVAGLSQQAPVKYNGVDVGYVDRLSINLKNPQQVILTLKIEPYVPVTENTSAILMSQGLTGIAYIGLQGGKPNSPLLEAVNGEAYPIIKSAPSFLVKLDQSLQSLTNNINKLTDNVRGVLNKDNLELFHHTLKNLDDLTTSLAENRSKLERSMTSLDITMKNAADSSKQLPALVQQFKTMSMNINQASRGVNQTLGVFSTQLIPEAYLTLQNIKGLSANLQTFSNQLEKNPSILIRGKAPAKPGPGE